MKQEELIIGTIYKIFDTKNNGSIIYSAARFDEKDKNGYKFTLINKSVEKVIHITSDELESLILTKSSYIKK